MKNKNFKKLGITLMSSVMLAGVFLPTVASADETYESQEQPTEEPQNDSNIDNNELNNFKNDLISQKGFTDEELSQFSNDDIVNMHNQLNISHDDTSNMNNKINGPQVKIGVSATAKAVLKVWKKLPKPVKSTIAKYTGISGFLKLIDHYTGTEEHIIYSACREAGMSPNVAHFVTSTITLFI